MGVALAAVTQDGYFFVFDQINIAIAIVVNAHIKFLRFEFSVNV
jgi:hypothetical protein